MNRHILFFFLPHIKITITYSCLIIQYTFYFQYTRNHPVYISITSMQALSVKEDGK